MPLFNYVIKFMKSGLKMLTEWKQKEKVQKLI